MAKRLCALRSFMRRNGGLVSTGDAVNPDDYEPSDLEYYQRGGMVGPVPRKKRGTAAPGETKPAAPGETKPAAPEGQRSD